MMAYIRSVLSHIWGKQDALFPFFLFYCNICGISARMPGKKKKGKRVSASICYFGHLPCVN